jgi:N-acetylglucosaminyldiphosphoundecaprenol N-acetyl-beta-D-mannosaminyltransferase
VEQYAIWDQLERFPVLEVPVCLIEESGQTAVDSYIDWLSSRLQQKLGTHVVTLNAEMTMQARQDPDLAKTIRQADLVIPDGSGVVLYLKLYGKRVQRCPGVELSESLLRRLARTQTDTSVFFYGGAPGVAAKARDRLQQKYPGLTIAGVEHGYIDAEGRERLKQTLSQLQPSLIYVGLGVPRQEFWIARHRHLCPNSIWIGVGGSFDIWAGVKDRAPQWFSDNHLEWAYRLYQEPWRARRMLALPRFAWRALVERLGR